MALLAQDTERDCLKIRNIYHFSSHCFYRPLCFMKNFFFQNRLMIIGILLGSVAGFLYWKFVGCSTGTCLITSKWHNSTAYGAVMGGLLLSIFKKEVKQEKNE